MIHHVYSILCTRVLRDADHGLQSIIDCVDGVVVASAVPVGARGVMISVGLQVFSFWTRLVPDIPAEGLTRMRLELPDGEMFDSAQVPIDLTHLLNAHVTTPIPVHPFTRAGRYWHVVEQRGDDGQWRDVARLPLDMTVADASAPVP